MASRRLSWPRGLRAYGRDERGAGAAELALWLVFMIWPFMNVVDLGYYLFQAMQVRAAAQAAADTAQTMCGQTGLVPAATKCTSALTQMTTAAHSTLLGSAVSFTTGVSAGASGSKPYEGYYCTNTANVLVNATSPWLINGTAIAEPTDCHNAVAGNTDAPADYVVVTTQYNYQPIFKNISLMGLIGSNSTITQVAWMRIS